MFIREFILYTEKFIYINDACLRIDANFDLFDFIFIDLEQLVIDQLFFAFILQCTENCRQ